MMGEGSIMIMSFVSLAMNIYQCGLTSLLFAFFSIMHVLQQKYNMISINLQGSLQGNDEGFKGFQEQSLWHNIVVFFVVTMLFVSMVGKKKKTY